MHLGHNARRDLGRGTGIAMDLGGRAVGGALGAVAAARAGKAVHPAGVVHRARLVIHGVPEAPRGSELLRTPAELPAVVRFSRSVGLPRPIPDLLGISLRVPDAYGRGYHQDILMVTSVDAPVFHHLFVPATDVQQRPYSSSLPYRAGNGRFLMGITPDPTSPRPSGADELDRLDRAAGTGRLVFGLAVAAILGRFRRVGSLHVEDRLPQTLDALRFNPFNSGGGLEPVGVLNRLRDYAYPLSQASWGRRSGRGAAQVEADAELRRVLGSHPAGGG